MGNLSEKLDAEKFNAMPETLREFYTPKEDGSYILNIEDRVDNSALLNAKRRETEEKNKIKKEKEELLSKLKQLEDSNKTILTEKESEIEKRLNELTSKFEQEKSKLREKAEKAEVEKVLSDVLDIFESKKIASPVIKSRIQIERDEEDSRIVFLDDSGKKTDWDLDKFKKSFLDDKEFKSIIKSNKSSGSSANSHNQKAVPSKSLKDMTLTERSILLAKDPEAYRELELRSK